MTVIAIIGLFVISAVCFRYFYHRLPQQRRVPGANPHNMEMGFQPAYPQQPQQAVNPPANQGGAAPNAYQAPVYQGVNQGGPAPNAYQQQPPQNGGGNGG